MTAQIVEWVRIEEMPEEYRDGRDVVGWDGGICVVGWRKQAEVPGPVFPVYWSDGFCERPITHFMPKLLGPGDVE